MTPVAIAIITILAVTVAAEAAAIYDLHRITRVQGKQLAAARRATQAVRNQRDALAAARDAEEHGGWRCPPGICPMDQDLPADGTYSPLQEG
jgi:hypothetical protein